MPTTRHKLEQMVVLLLQEDLPRWPVAGLIAFVRDTAAGLQWSQSVRGRLRKRQIEALLSAVTSEHDGIGAPSNAKH